MCIRDRIKIGLEYLFMKKGFGRENFLEMGGFAKSHDELHRPNLQFHFMNGLFKNHNKTKIRKDGFTLHVCNLYPESVSYTHLDVYKRQSGIWSM